MPNSTKSQKKIRLGCVQYLNALPFYHGLESDECIKIEFEKATPAKLNEAIRAGELDVAISSSLEYARNSNDYFIIPDLCIGAGTFSESVLLISRVPLNQLNGGRIILTEESLSSQVLLKILFKHMDFDVKFQILSPNPDLMLIQGDACLLIGDSALFYEVPKAYYRYDLSYLWEQVTGLPFCFALWIVRKNFAKENPVLIDDFVARLLFNFSHNVENLWEIVKESDHISENADDKLLVFDKCLNYLSNLQFRLDGPMKRGLMRYFELAKEIGELREIPHLNFLAHNV